MKDKYKILLALINIVFFTWLSVFNILCLEDYTWRWSENNGVLSLQYLVNGLWHTSTLLLPLWALFGTALILTGGFDKDK